MRSMSVLVLLRHGQSQWNLENRFTGWTDVPLTEQGKKDAAASGNTLRDYSFDLAFTSRLIRAQDTLTVVLETLGQTSVPVERDSALNERHYGDLQGLNKAETVQKHGEEQVQLWRRSFSTRPPNGESIEDCVRRVTPFVRQYILPHVYEGKNVLVAAHGNSLRPMLRLLDGLSDEETASKEIGLCVPHVYEFTGETIANRRVIEVPGIVTKGASLTEKTVQSGNV